MVIDKQHTLVVLSVDPTVTGDGRGCTCLSRECVLNNPLRRAEQVSWKPPSPSAQIRRHSQPLQRFRRTARCQLAIRRHGCGLGRGEFVPSAAVPHRLPLTADAGHGATVPLRVRCAPSTAHAQYAILSAQRPYGKRAVHLIEHSHAHKLQSLTEGFLDS